ncbi:Probable membrane transport protein [Mycobacteroides abscessus subsp. abscessus]|nr:Probable membrane transport protein [Mycobacteroides abscessus subsp. abscessus]
MLTSGTMLIIFTLSFMTNTYFPGFARSELHFSRVAILAAGALGAVVLMVSATVGGILSDRLGRRTVILSSMTLTLRRLHLRHARNVGRIGTLNRSACGTQLPATDSR